MLVVKALPKASSSNLEKEDSIMTLPSSLGQISPRVMPPLDEDFCPAALFNRAFRKALGLGGLRLVIGLERGEDGFSRFETQVFPDDHPLS